ncbi:MAG: hypothetical protein IT384_02300 [Deltaproteobacteria bacterium]|nr:hypothetical protein [Deltaproteobacteria bacterium]
MGQDEDPTSAAAPSFDASKVRPRAHRDPANTTTDQPVDATRTMRSAPPPTGDPAVVAQPSSTELSEASRRERRKERDRRAEKAARRAVLGLFLGGGALLFVLINSGALDDLLGGPPPSAPPGATGVSGEAPVAPPPPAVPRTTAAPVENPDLPALSSLRSEGLTMAAEGLPQVLAVDPPVVPPLLAGLETCRFAYAIWELSPNGVFRFLTTCGGLEGQVLVGAYEVRGSKIVTSPLSTDGIELVSTFEIEKPSSVRTEVTVALPRGPVVRLAVQQRITVIRPGMEGEGFWRNYAPKNTVQVQGLSAPEEPKKSAPAPSPAKPAPREKAKDPVLELLDN